MAVSKKILWILIGVSLKFTLLLGAIIDTESTDSSEISIESEDIADKNQLIFVHVIYRHGDRNPMSSYPNDPYKNESHWKNGFGALTNVGKREQYELGKYLQAKYHHLIGAHYSPEKVYIVSTDEDRNLMSAQCNAAGLFPPSGDEVWNKNLMWQPIPIHTMPLDSDILLNSFVPCPKFDNLFRQRMESPEITSLLENNRPLVEFMQLHSGTPLEKLTDVLNLYNIIYVQNRNGFALPDWAKYILKFNKTLDYLGAMNYQSVSYSTEMKKIRAGFLLREILDRSKNKTLSVLQPDRSLWIYAAHGSIVANVLNSLNLFELRIPLFSSSIIFELYKRGEEHYIQISYRNTVSENAAPLNIPNCGTMCPLDKFYELYRHILPTDDEDFDSLCRFV